MEVFVVMEGRKTECCFDFEYDLAGIFRTLQEARCYCGSRGQKSFVVSLEQYLEGEPTPKERYHFLIIRTNLGE